MKNKETKKVHPGKKMLKVRKEYALKSSNNNRGERLTEIKVYSQNENKVGQ